MLPGMGRQNEGAQSTHRDSASILMGGRWTSSIQAEAIHSADTLARRPSPASAANSDGKSRHRQAIQRVRHTVDRAGERRARRGNRRVP